MKSIGNSALVSVAVWQDVCILYRYNPSLRIFFFFFGKLCSGSMQISTADGNDGHDDANS